MRHSLLGMTALASLLLTAPAFAETVTFWQFSTNPNDIAAWEGIIKAFEASHEGVDVQMEIVPWSEQQQRLVTALTTGGLPDVSMLGNNVVAQFQATGALAPLDDAFAAYDAANGTKVADDIWPGDKGYYNLDGHWWASPIAVETRAIGIRPEDILLDQGNLTATVTHTEYLGSDTYAYMKLEDENLLTVRIPGNAHIEPGMPRTFGFDPKSVHRFNKNGTRI